MSRRRLVWTGSTIRWWDRLGHLNDCPCRSETAGLNLGAEGGQRTVNEDTYQAVMRCWRSAVDQMGSSGPLTPREHVHATRAMYAFRDRATRPLARGRQVHLAPTDPADPELTLGEVRISKAEARRWTRTAHHAGRGMKVEARTWKGVPVLVLTATPSRNPTS